MSGDNKEGLEARIANLTATRHTQVAALVKDHGKERLAHIVVASRIAHAERDLVQRDLSETLDRLLRRGDIYPYARDIARAALTRAEGK